jgi:hypothetical protein
MPNWKKIIVSGSNAVLNSLNVTTSITGSTAQLTGIPSGTSETNIILTDGSGNLVTRSASSLSVASASYADQALSASFALTSSFASTGNNFVGTGTTYLNNLDLATQGSTVASVTTTTGSLILDGSTDLTLISAGVDSAEAMFIDYVLYDLAKNNKRAGNLRLTWNTSTTVFDETSTIDIGDTSGFVFTVDNNGSDAKLLATNNVGEDISLIYEYKLLYIV